MLDHLLPIVLTIVAWWFCTGILLFLHNLPAATRKWSLTGATLLLVGGLATLDPVAQDASRAGAIVAFLQALAIWAWLEMTYLTGAIAGASRQPCPAGVGGWRRFRLAIMTSIHHEVAVVVVGAVILLLTWNAINPFCGLAYLTLWLMRWSAKLNLFLGVSNVNEDWFPADMRFLVSYMQRRRMNPLFPFSIAAASTIAAYWIYLAGHAPTAHARTGYTLVATLLCLAILEHGFMVLRVRDSALWNWALRAANRFQKRGIPKVKQDLHPPAGRI